MSIAKNLKRLRQEAEFTQERLGKLSGVNSMAICHYEAGRRKPGIDNILKLCKALKCEPNDLIKKR